MTAIAFGPVPSRRLGQSLGINNIPPKSCSYACVYCQVGRTLELAVERRAFRPPVEVVHRVETRVREVRARGEAIDYLTFVPDGEPTLDLHLGREITGLRPLGIPVAVITNAFLLDRSDVQSDLLRADWVSLKVDAVRDTRRPAKPARPAPRPAVATRSIRSSVTGVSPFDMPSSPNWTCRKPQISARSNVFFAQASGQPSIARTRSAAWVLARMRDSDMDSDCAVPWLTIPAMLAAQTWAICRSTNVTGPTRRRRAQNTAAQVPKPAVHSAM